MTIWDIPQYLGVALGLIGALFVCSASAASRRNGFAIWIGSNACLIAWACHAQAWGLLAMYIVYSITSVRGFFLNRQSVLSESVPA